MYNIIVWLEKNKDHAKYFEVIRYLITVFTLHKVVTVPIEPGFESICDPFSGVDEYAKFIDLARVFESLNIDKDLVLHDFHRLCADNHFIESMSAGPNGSATWASHLDAYELYNDQKLYGVIKDLCAVTNMPFIVKMLLNINDDFINMDFTFTEYTNLVHSKIIALYEKATKARIIAIGDYFSQTILSPFHDTLANILKTIPMDCTFNQDEGFKRVLELTRGQKAVYSLDLSKATDRIPVKALSRMISYITGNELIGEL